MKKLLIPTLVILILLTGCSDSFSDKKFSSYTAIESGFEQSGLSWGMSMDEVKEVVPDAKDYTPDSNELKSVSTNIIAYNLPWSLTCRFGDDGLNEITLLLLLDEETYSSYRGYEREYFEKTPRQAFESTFLSLVELFDNNVSLQEESAASDRYTWEQSDCIATLSYTQGQEVAEIVTLTYKPN